VFTFYTADPLASGHAPEQIKVFLLLLLQKENLPSSAAPTPVANVFATPPCQFGTRRNAVNFRDRSA
jgi:hypothetical protein